MTASELSGGWWRPFRQLDGVAVVHVDLAPDAASEERAWSWLDEEERLRWQRFQNEGARRRYARCRASLRSLLCTALDCSNQSLAFDATAHGKPYATVRGVPTPVSFNVSHSGQHGLIALARGGQVGVDVEEPVSHRRLDVLIAGILSPLEQAELAAAAGHRKLRLFLRLWTIKEALSKAHGMGLSLDVSGFEVPQNMRDGDKRGVFRFSHMPDVAWKLENIGTGQFEAAVAYAGDHR